MNESVFYVAIVAAAGSIIYALLTRKQVMNSRALVKEASLRLEKSQKKAQKLENQLNQAQNSSQQLRNSLQTAEKKLSETQKKLFTKDDAVEKVKSDFDAKLVIEARKRDHLEEQNKALTTQLAEAVKEKKEAQSEAKQLGNKAVSKDDFKAAQANVEDAQKQITQLRKQNKSLKNEVSKAREVLSKVKPGELKRLKVKASRMEQLYTSMKGLREMAEERNENWESALKLMATHITGKTLGDNTAVAPLVGSALEKIGAVLVKDEHTLDDSEDAIDLSVNEEGSLDSTTSSPVASEVVETV